MTPRLLTLILLMNISRGSAAIFAFQRKTFELPSRGYSFEPIRQSANAAATPSPTSSTTLVL
jgi:hypothetical protein